MTAVEWLMQQIDNEDMGEIPMWVYDFCNDALEMEKEQIEILKNSILELFEMVHNGCNIRDQIRANEIYYETYKKDNQ